MKLGKLFIGKQVCNEPTVFTIMSWNYKSGYWIWVIQYRKFNSVKETFKYPLFGPSYNSGKIYSPSRGRFGAWLVIPFIGYFTFNTQPVMKSMDY